MIPSLVQDELAAMNSIAAILSDIDDPGARRRILHWAVDALTSDAADASKQDASEQIHEGRANNHARSASIRSSPRASDASAPRTTPVMCEPPRDGATTQDEALAFVGVELLFDEEEAPAERPAFRESDPVESMVHGFVADFRRLARDWKVA
jgi:hypothetical protein